jgi:hypothetical protein
MAAPGKYTPSFSFSGYQATQPDRPLPGPRHDTEYFNIAYSLGQTIDALNDIRRDDGKLENGIVDWENLAPGLGDSIYPDAPSDGHVYGRTDATWQRVVTVRIGDSPPGGLHVGDLFWESDTGDLFVNYNDGDSTQLVQVAGPGMGAAADAAAARAEEAAQEAQEAADIAAGYASDAVSQGNVPIYATVVGMAAISVPAGIGCIRINGYHAAGDGGGALYKRVVSAPAHAGKVQSMDGAWWELSPGDIPNVRAWGAKPGLANDATAGIQALLDYYAIAYAVNEESGGGTVNLGDGLYRTTAPLNVKCRNILIKGNGKRSLQDGMVGPRSESGPGAIYANHNGDAITVSSAYDANGFQFKDATLIQATSPRPAGSKGIHFISAGARFLREFVISDASIAGFDHAIHLSKTGTEVSMGVIRVHRCNIMFNGNIHQHDATSQWNVFSFKDNDAGQNFNGLTVKAQNFTCVSNVLEGQPNPVTIIGAYRACIIEGNYFEANTGSACITAAGVRHGRIGPNFYLNILSDYKANVGGIGMVLQDPAFISASMLCAPAVHRSRPGRGDESEITMPATGAIYWGNVERARSEYTPPKGVLSYTSMAPDVRDLWVDGRVIGVRDYTTSGTGLVTFTHSVVANAGDILVANTLVKYTNDIPASARFGMYVNSSSDPAKGSTSPAYAAFAAAPLNEWLVVTTAVRALEAVTTLQVLFYPFDISPAAGLYMRYGRPIVNVVTHPNDIVPWSDIDRLTKHTAAPTIGTWLSGDKIYHITPVAAGNIGWVCTTAGTPGTWKTFGAISA